MNRLNRLYLINSKENKAVQFSDEVRSSLSEDLEYTLIQRDVKLVENDDILIPALWIGNDVLIGYSRNGYQNKTWILPKMWERGSILKISRISIEGKTLLRSVKIVDRKISLSLGKDEMVIIE